MTLREEFEAATLVQKINMIDKVINENIRDFLVKDNGDMELLNVVEKNELLLVYIEFQGACVSCDSSGGTHKSIENIFNRMLADNIRVITL
jgi:NifU-like protein